VCLASGGGGGADDNKRRTVWNKDDNIRPSLKTPRQEIVVVGGGGRDGLSICPLASQGRSTCAQTMRPLSCFIIVIDCERLPRDLHTARAAVIHSERAHLERGPLAAATPN
jgi:hypothetical protein